MMVMVENMPCGELPDWVSKALGSMAAGAAVTTLKEIARWLAFRPKEVKPPEPPEPPEEKPSKKRPRRRRKPTGRVR